MCVILLKEHNWERTENLTATLVQKDLPSESTRAIIESCYALSKGSIVHRAGLVVARHIDVESTKSGSIWKGYLLPSASTLELESRLFPMARL